MFCFLETHKKLECLRYNNGRTSERALSHANARQSFEFLKRMKVERMKLALELNAISMNRSTIYLLAVGVTLLG